MDQQGDAPVQDALGRPDDERESNQDIPEDGLPQIALEPPEPDVHPLPVLPCLFESALPHFIEMAELVQKAYDDKPKVPEGPDQTICGKYEFWGGANGGQIGMWYHGHEHRLVIVIRGTKHARDLHLDRALFDESVHGTKGEFTKEVLSIYDAVIELLEDKLGLITSDTPINITGHSLGAAFAEALLHLFLSQSHYCIVQATTFDSPGLPHRFREGYRVQTPLPHLLSLQSTPNPINTLNPPLAGRALLHGNGTGGFYACGRGSNEPITAAVAGHLFRPSELWGFIPSSLNPYNSTRRLFDSHTMTHIQTFLEKHDIQPEDPRRWPRFTLKKSVPGRLCLNILGGPLAQPIEPPALQHPAQAHPSPMAALAPVAQAAPNKPNAVIAAGGEAVPAGTQVAVIPKSMAIVVGVAAGGGLLGYVLYMAGTFLGPKNEVEDDREVEDEIRA